MKTKMPGWAVVFAIMPPKAQQGIGCLVAIIFAPAILVAVFIAIDRLLPVLSVAGAIWLLYIIGNVCSADVNPTVHKGGDLCLAPTCATSYPLTTTALLNCAGWPLP